MRAASSVELDSVVQDGGIAGHGVGEPNVGAEGSVSYADTDDLQIGTGCEVPATSLEAAPEG
ncbi:hypothetical protein GCM10010411_37410 [Actinomadura fulvescens]|uniref:Uncharacterized protein n=1 Tax=Actinomadura fulvescens TaxID=46160 RepID=A0ABN3PSC6_9ACTN